MKTNLRRWITLVENGRLAMVTEAPRSDKAAGAWIQFQNTYLKIGHIKGSSIVYYMMPGGRLITHDY
jgi:hypothetical protein